MGDTASIHRSGNSERVPLEGLSEGSLEQAVESARARGSEVERQISELNRFLAAAKEEQRLLERLLALRRGERPREAEEDGSRAGVVQDTALGGGHHSVVDPVLAVLEEAGHPLHISEIMRLLQDRKVPLPGAGNQANVISYLRRDPRVARPSRGIYGLRSWGLQEMPTRVPRKRRKRRKVAAVSSR